MSLTALVEARRATRAGHVLGTACRYVPLEVAGTTSDIGELLGVRVERADDCGRLRATRTDESRVLRERACAVK
jgi:hypothetical protein